MGKEAHQELSPFSFHPKEDVLQMTSLFFSFSSISFLKTQISEYIITNHGKDIGCDPHLLNQDEEGMLYEHKCSEHTPVGHLSLEIEPMAPRHNQLESETEK